MSFPGFTHATNFQLKQAYSRGGKRPITLQHLLHTNHKCARFRLILEYSCAHNILIDVTNTSIASAVLRLATGHLKCALFCKPS